MGTLIMLGVLVFLFGAVAFRWFLIGVAIWAAVWVIGIIVLVVVTHESPASTHLKSSVAISEIVSDVDYFYNTHITNARCSPKPEYGENNYQCTVSWPDYGCFQFTVNANTVPEKGLRVKRLDPNECQNLPPTSTL